MLFNGVEMGILSPLCVLLLQCLHLTAQARWQNLILVPAILPQDSQCRLTQKMLKID